MAEFGPGPHPPPPKDLTERKLRLVKFNDILWRIYENKYPTPLYFGANSRNRFDAPDRSFSVCYCSCDYYGAFVETFGHSAGFNIITMRTLEARSLIRVSCTTPLLLIDLTGPGLKLVGADSRLIIGGDYSITRNWALGFYKHKAQADGILYRSRNDPDRYSLALFYRAADRLVVDEELQLSSSLARPIIIPIIDHYGFGLG